MNDITFQSWISIVGPLAAMMVFLYVKIERNENRLGLNDERWAELLKAFCDFKNVTVERFAKLENKPGEDR